MSGSMRRLRGNWRQHGGVALEFVFLAPFVLLLIYAVIGYSIAFVMLQSLHQLSAASARAAVVVSTVPGIDPEQRDAAIQQRIDAVLERSWLRSDQVSGCANGSRFDWRDDGTILQVCLEVPNPVPAIRLGGVRVPHFDATFNSWSEVGMGSGE